MNRLPGNPFSGNVGGLMPTEAQAMMALAFEQRTANLIALMNTDHANGSKYFLSRIESAAKQIVARLGLENR